MSNIQDSDKPNLNTIEAYRNDEPLQPLRKTGRDKFKISGSKFDKHGYYIDGTIPFMRNTDILISNQIMNKVLYFDNLNIDGDFITNGFDVSIMVKNKIKVGGNLVVNGFIFANEIHANMIMTTGHIVVHTGFTCTGVKSSGHVYIGKSTNRFTAFNHAVHIPEQGKLYKNLFEVSIENDIALENVYIAMTKGTQINGLTIKKWK
jgi:hypothetical protein